MNIFQQFGIKEVADVVLYAIELDKYDNEIYIPMMYFDTLKVSTVEQTAESTSARGGLNNPELIAWDFGKEINVNLEDALYTPASQSLMWGGKFGINKLKVCGVWNPYVYSQDSFGRPIYVNEVEVAETERYDSVKEAMHILIDGKAYHFIVPLWLGDSFLKREYDESVPIPDNAVGHEYVWFGYHNENIVDYQYTLVKVDGQYFMETSYTYASELPDYEPLARFAPTDEFDDLIYFICPCDDEVKWIKVVPADGHYKYYRLEDSDGNWGKLHWKEDQLVPTDYKCPSDNPIQESEEIERLVQKYSIKDNLTPEIAWADLKYPERAILNIDQFGDFEFHTYEFLTKEEDETEVCYYSDIDICDAPEGTVKCTTESSDAYGYIWKNSDFRLTALEGNQDTFYLENLDLRYRIRTDNNLKEIALEYSEDNENEYYPKINVYKKIVYKKVNEDGIEEDEIRKILAGTFYIIDDWNQTESAFRNGIYDINSGLENVDYLERMELCKAKKTFAIDTNKNIRCSNYSQMPQYKHTELTVFINPKTMLPYEANADSFLRANGQLLTGSFTIIKQNECYYKWTRTKAPEYSSLGYQITVDAEHFPGTYRIVGHTFARARSDGQDKRFQFEIPLCKLLSSSNLTLQAEGDPTTFTMNFKVLRRDDGVMMKLIQYDVEENSDFGSTKVIPTDRLPENDENMELEDNAGATVVERWGAYRATVTNSTINIVNPTENTVIYIDEDEQAPFSGVWPYVSKITEEDLNNIIENSPIPLGDDTTETVPNETLTVEPAQIVSTYLVVCKDITYSVDRLFEKVIKYSNGSYGPVISSEWIHQKDITAKDYLNPDEYEFDMNGNITLNEG